MAGLSLIIRVAPESASTYRISDSVYAGFTGTQTKPARATAR